MIIRTFGEYKESERLLKSLSRMPNIYITELEYLAFLIREYENTIAFGVK